MTRINGNIQPEKLIDQHLLAEYREIVRIPNMVKKNINLDFINKKLKSIPENFKLGTGHVLFFYNKISFLHKRFLLLKDELSNRNIINNMDDSPFKNIPCILYNDINEIDNKIIIDRISERINSMKKLPRYKGINITREQAINLIN